MVFLCKSASPAASCHCGVACKVRDVVEDQDFGDLIFRDILENGAAEEPHIDQMRLGEVVHRKLREAVGIGILDDQKLPRAGAGDDRCLLIGVQEDRILVAALEVAALVDRVGHIVVAVVIDRVSGVFVVRVDGVTGCQRIVHLVVRRSAENVAELLLRPLSDGHSREPAVPHPRSVGVVGAEARPVVSTIPAR